MEEGRADADNGGDGTAAVVRLNVVSYSTVINAYAKRARRDPAAVERAEEILAELEDAYLVSLNSRDGGGGGNGIGRDRVNVVKPNVRTYTSVIDAHANSRAPLAADDAVRLLRRLQHLYDSSARCNGGDGNPDLRPTIQTYSAALAALSKSADWDAADRDAADKAKTLLREMERDRSKPDPNVRCYDSVLDALARRATDVEGAAVWAMELLERMEFLANRRGRRASADAGGDDWEEEDGGRRGEGDNGGDGGGAFGGAAAAVVTNAFTYGAVISAWARSHEPHRTEMTRALLEEMAELGEYDPGLRPNLYHYNRVINACAGRIAPGNGDLAGGANDESRRRAFDIALETYNRVNGGGAGGRRRGDTAEGENDDDDDGAANEQRRRRRGGGGRQPAPPPRLAHVRLLPQGGGDQPVPFGGRAEPAVEGVLADDESRRRAFDIALETYNRVIGGSRRGDTAEEGNDDDDNDGATGDRRQLRQGEAGPPLRPDSRTYAFFLKALATNPSPSGDERSRLSRECFVRSRRDGLVSGGTVRRLLGACRPRPGEYMEPVGAFGPYAVNVGDLPEEWSRNARG